MREVTVHIPASALASLHDVAAERDMPFEALLRFYIGQGLRRDLAERYSRRVADDRDGG